MQQRGRWVALPTVMQQHSELSRVQHCDSSNTSDISVQKVKSQVHTSKNNNNSFYNVVKLIVTCL